MNNRHCEDICETLQARSAAHRADNAVALANQVRYRDAELSRLAELVAYLTMKQAELEARLDTLDGGQ